VILVPQINQLRLTVSVLLVPRSLVLGPVT
jgi:hypothetical protein